MAGKYTIEMQKIISEGKFSTIYEGKDQYQKTVSAKKIRLNPNDAQSAIRYVNFCELPYENRNIAKTLCVTFDSHTSTVWQVQEFFEYRDLQSYLDSHQAAFHDAGEKKDLIVQITRGLAFLHACNIVHGNIKPANILIKEGKSPSDIIAKLSDFAIVTLCQKDREIEHPDLRGLHYSDKSLLYKPPEYWDESLGPGVKYTQKYDIFSAGLIFLAILKRDTPLTPNIHKIDDPLGHLMFTRKQDFKVTDDRFDRNPNEKLINSLVRKMVRLKANDRETTKAILQVMCIISMILGLSSLIILTLHKLTLYD